MTHWNILKKTALLGTEKMPFAIETLPIAIQKAVEKADKNDAEGLFLKASAMLFTYSKAGQSPIKVTLPELSLSEDENQTICPNEVKMLWKKVLDNEPFNTYLYDYLIDKCIENQWVVADDLLVEVLNKSSKKTLPNVHQVVGVRGKWLSQFNEAWQIKMPDEKQSIWEEGKPAERKEYFSRLRTEKPDEALVLLQQSWENESAKDRKDLLALLAINLSENEEVFLKDKHRELITSNASQKPVTLETIQLINELRLMIKNSAFGQAVFEEVKNCIEKKKGILNVIGLGGAYQLNLPKQETRFWNGTDMNQTFGFDKLSSQKGVSEMEYWLSELLRIIHPSHWIEFFEGDIKKMVTFFTDAENIRKKDKPAYLYSLSQAMQIADSEHIKVFLENTAKSETKWIELLNSLDGPTQEQLVMQHFDLNVATIKTLITNDIQSGWSVAFSQFVLQALLKEMHGSNYYYLFSDKDFINRLARKLAIKTKDSIALLGQGLPQDWQKNYWISHFSEPIIKQLDIKEEIEKI